MNIKHRKLISLCLIALNIMNAVPAQCEDAPKPPSTGFAGLSPEQKNSILVMLERITHNHNITAGLVESAAKEGLHAQARLLTLVQAKHRELSVHVFHLSTMEDLVTMAKDRESATTSAGLIASSYEQAISVGRDLDELVTVARDLAPESHEFVEKSCKFIENIIEEYFIKRRNFFRQWSEANRTGGQ